MSLGMNDPRVHEYRDARNAAGAGLSAPPGSHERYERSIGPYIEVMAEMCDSPLARISLMTALLDDAKLPLGAILVGFRATVEERTAMSNLPPLVEEYVDEQARLAALPYGMYLKTAHWQRVRAAALKYYEYRCAAGNCRENLQVHHRDYSRKGAERPVDVIVYCDMHHKMYHDAKRRKKAA